MPQYRLITTGPYAGRVLELPDDVAKAAEKDGWAVDTTGKDYDPYNTPITIGAPPYAPSLQSFLDGLAGGGGAEPPKEEPKAKAAPAKVEPKPEPKSEPKPEAKAAAKVEDEAPAAKAEEPKGKSK